MERLGRGSVPAAGGESGQAMMETMLVFPFFLLLIMIMLEFVIYFYKGNVLENTAQQVGRMAARGATLADISSVVDNQLAALSAQEVGLEVRDAAGGSITEWESDDAIEIRLTATVEPIMPIGVLNVFAPGTDFFPDQYSLGSVKQVYVE